MDRSRIRKCTRHRTVMGGGVNPGIEPGSAAPATMGRPLLRSHAPGSRTVTISHTGGAIAHRQAPESAPRPLQPSEHPEPVLIRGRQEGDLHVLQEALDPRGTLGGGLDAAGGGRGWLPCCLGGHIGAIRRRRPGAYAGRTDLHADGDAGRAADGHRCARAACRATAGGAGSTTTPAAVGMSESADARAASIRPRGCCGGPAGTACRARLARIATSPGSR